MTTVTDVRTLLALADLSDEAIEPHLNRALFDTKDVTFEDGTQELEAVGWRTIYYVSPALWLLLQKNVNEMDETLQTFKDLKQFQEYCLDRADSAMPSDTTGNEELAWDAT